MTIGLKRSENLYQIKKGNNRISRDLTELITAKYPVISKGWLLAGEGEMLIRKQRPEPAAGIPYYAMDAIQAAEESPLPEPSFHIHVPIFNDCDFAALALGTAMQPELPAGSIALLKRWEVDTLIPGESYLILSPAFRGFRIIRRTETPGEVLLLARNTEEYDAITLQEKSIRKLFIVRGVIIKKIL